MPDIPDESGIVAFTVDDPEDAKNWPAKKKKIVVLQTCLLSFAAGFGSSVFAPEELQLIARFGINDTTADAGLAVFVLGFSFGPIFCPMSEYCGRRLPYLVSWLLLLGATAPTAFANNVPVIIVFRFIAGCCAACAQNNPLGFYSDMYGSDAEGRKKAMGAYSLAFCTGPMIAVPIGFLILANTGSKDWVMRCYFFFILALLPVAFLLPESHGPTILASRAKEMRKAGIHNARASHENSSNSLRKIISVHIIRPIDMLIREPICIGSGIWISLGSALIYLFFEIFPLVFLEKHQFSLADAGLPFFSLLVGVAVAVVLVGVLNKFIITWRIPLVQPPNATPDCPETHLKMSLLGCLLMPVSLFWFAWSSSSNVHWIVPTLSGIPFAVSILLIFMSFVSYISHTYTIFANSANASNSFMRSFASFALALSSHKIVNTLGFNWGVSLFAFLSFGLLPIPLIFLRYGAQLRSRSYYAKEAAEIISELRATSSPSGEKEKANSLDTSALKEEVVQLARDDSSSA